MAIDAISGLVPGLVPPGLVPPGGPAAAGGLPELNAPANVEFAPSPIGEMPAAGPDFGRLLSQGLEGVSSAERQADTFIQQMAAGQPVQPHQVMIATQKALMSVELAVALRDKALEAYREVMNLQL